MEKDSPIRLLLQNLLASPIESIKRFPLPILFAVLTTVLLIYGTVPNGDYLLRLAMVSALAFAASLLLSLYFEAASSPRSRRLLAAGIVLVAVGLYAHFAIPDEPRPAPSSFWYFHWILLFALHLGIALVPLRATRAVNTLWHFNLLLFFRFFFSSVNALILFTGVALAIFSVEKLFGANLDNSIYKNIWLICWFAFHPLLVLGGVPEIQRMPPAPAFPRALRFSLRFIAVPLVLLYLLILYLYVLKILFQWSWPDGWVAMPIFILAVISLLTFVLSLPLTAEEQWARLYHRWIFLALLPLSIVLFLALEVRVSTYGMTIHRYLGLALAIWLFGNSLAGLLRPRLHMAWIPGSLLAVALWSILTGPFGAFGWSQRSQLQRIDTIAQSIGVWQDGRLHPGGSPRDERAAELRSSLHYVLQHFGEAPLDHRLQHYFEARNINSIAGDSPYWQSTRIMEFLGLDTSLTDSEFYLAEDGPRPTYGKAYQIRLDTFHTGWEFEIDGVSGHLETRFDRERQLFTVLFDHAVLYQADLGPWTEELLKRSDAMNRGRAEPLVQHHSEGGWKITVVVTFANIDRRNHRIRQINGYLFFTPPKK